MEQFILRYTTDTATTETIVPIYVIHTIDRPFCPVPDCWCHQNQQEIAKLLTYVHNGEMTLREAADFADGRMI